MCPSSLLAESAPLALVSGSDCFIFFPQIRQWLLTLLQKLSYKQELRVVLLLCAADLRVNFSPWPLSKSAPTAPTLAVPQAGCCVSFSSYAGKMSRPSKLCCLLLEAVFLFLETTGLVLFCAPANPPLQPAPGAQSISRLCGSLCAVYSFSQRYFPVVTYTTWCYLFPKYAI